MESKSMYSQDRSILRNAIPLAAPYVIHLELTSFCNIRCEYCIHALSRQEMMKNKHLFGTMDDTILNRVFEGLRDFPVSVKKIVLGGIGEPTLFKGLPDVISKIKLASPSTKVGLITNGILLTKELSAGLINAGINEVKISLQGLSAKEYLEHCGATIDFDTFLANLQYLFDNKNDSMKVLMKIPSDYLTPETQQRYFELFGKCCDSASIENLSNCFKLDNDKMEKFALNDDRFGIQAARPVSVCAIPFYRLDVLCNGDISLCNACRNIGFITDENIGSHSLTEIWNGTTRKSFLLNVLRGDSGDIPSICRDCFCRTTFAFEADRLDDCADEIIEKINKLV